MFNDPPSEAAAIGDALCGRATKLDIVIVNWNSGDLLGACLDALAAAAAARDLHVIVVDNASRDGSDAVATAPRPGLAVTLIRNAMNRGFAAACNQGAARGQSPLVLFLNPDTRVEPDTLTKAMDFLASPAGEGVGILGVKLLGEGGRTERTCARAPSPRLTLARAVALDRIAPAWVPPHFMVEWDHQDTREVAQVMGAFLLIRRPLLAALGGFDERFFVYYEDLDLCLRATQNGTAVVHFAGASVWHQGQGTTAQVKDRRLFYILRSEVLFAAKHFGTAIAVALLALQLAVQIPLRTGRAAASGAPGEWRQVLRGAGLLIRDTPRLLRRLLQRA
ncbi:glycosyltransferase family 2 protein [Chelatococcus reniformis]|uniref:Glycosyl transferase n=1 Tax=Chelatococcus reniformis TaxID=1494448 RepID=A0A916XC91_9HYPH|nr:glycosyltransferase family 2 protein [Chelatococcus reniformis]GGC63304.1 glycosyl transferase [Chelatococcus reniformis]